MSPTATMAKARSRQRTVNDRSRIVIMMTPANSARTMMPCLR